MPPTQTTSPDADFKAILDKYNYTPPASGSSSSGGQDWYSYVKSNSKSAAGPTKPSIADVSKSIVKPVTDTATEAGKILDKGGQAVMSDVQKGAEAFQKGNILKGLGRSGLDVAGDVAGTAGELGGAVVKPAIEAGAKGLESIPQLHDALGSLGDLLLKGGEAAQKFETDHPEIAKAISSVFNIATLGGGKAVEPGVNAALKEGKEAVEGAVSKVGETVKPLLDARKAKAAAKDAQNLDKLAGTIVQGKSADIAKAKSALSSIDVSDIKTYDDLHTALDDKITNLSSKLDETLGTNKEAKTLDNLSLKSKVNGQEVSHNYVDDALKQLKEFYTKTNAPEKAAKIEQLQTKAASDGLTAKELNDIAKMHGADLNAFNANGEAASGITKQAAENTRTGLKSTAREMFDNPLYKTADKEISGLIRTKDLVGKMSEEVNKLQQKVKERTWGEKAGRLFGQVINLVGMNSPKGFVEYFLGRGTGLKTLNALDLEAKLNKNLKSLQAITKPGASEQDIEARLQEIIDQSKTATPAQ